MFPRRSTVDQSAGSDSDRITISMAMPRDVLQIELKYIGGRRERRSVITGLERISKPGRRTYVGKNKIPWVLSGMGISILTTSKGIMTGQQARRQGVGGEVICRIW